MAADGPAPPKGIGVVGGGQRVECPGPSVQPRFWPQYFTDAADAATWLQEQRSALESTPCTPDQAGTEALLLGHLRLEPTLRAFGAELQQLDEQARAAAARASLTVRVGCVSGVCRWGGLGEGKGCRTTGFQHQMRCAPSPMATQRVEMGGHLWPLTLEL